MELAEILKNIDNNKIDMEELDKKSKYNLLYSNVIVNFGEDEEEANSWR